MPRLCRYRLADSNEHTNKRRQGNRMGLGNLFGNRHRTVVRPAAPVDPQELGTPPSTPEIRDMEQAVSILDALAPLISEGSPTKAVRVQKYADSLHSYIVTQPAGPRTDDVLFFEDGWRGATANEWRSELYGPLIDLARKNSD